MCRACQEARRLTVAVEDLIPGDLLSLEMGQVLPADCLLLEGEVIVDESVLTGEAEPVAKEPVPCIKVARDRFVYQKNVDVESINQVLLSGSRLLHCRSRPNRDVKAVVLRTGLTTVSGRLRRQISTTNEDTAANRALNVYIASMAVVTMIFATVSLTWNLGRLHPKVVSLRFLDLMSSGIPVGLPTALNTANSVAMWRLHKRRVECLDPSSLSTTGQSNLLVFDKTRTVTNEKMTIVSVLPTVVNQYLLRSVPHRVRFADQVASDSESEVQVGSLDTGSLFYGPEVSSLENEDDSNRLPPLRRSPFLRNGARAAVLGSMVTSPLESPELAVAMALSNALIHMDGQVVGDMIDIQLLNWAGFHLLSGTSRDIVIRGHGQAYVILQRFPFSSAALRTSVVALELDTTDAYCFTKGAPEVILELCDPVTVPVAVKESLVHFGSKGQRVVAFAFRKLLPSIVPWSDLTQHAAEGMSQLSFLGLVVFENPLKSGAVEVFHELKRAGVHSVLCSGDNVYTTLAVGSRLMLTQPASLKDFDSSFEEASIDEGSTLRCLVPEVHNGVLDWLEIEIDTRIEPDICDPQVEVPPVDSGTSLLEGLNTSRMSQLSTSTWCVTSDDGSYNRLRARRDSLMFPDSVSFTEDAVLTSVRHRHTRLEDVFKQADPRQIVLVMTGEALQFLVSLQDVHQQWSTLERQDLGGPHVLHVPIKHRQIQKLMSNIASFEHCVSPPSRQPATHLPFDRMLWFLSTPEPAALVSIMSDQYTQGEASAPALDTRQRRKSIVHSIPASSRRSLRKSNSNTPLFDTIQEVKAARARRKRREAAGAQFVADSGCDPAFAIISKVTVLEFVLRKCRCWARMAPQHKSLLVRTLQSLPEKPTVTFCGDGANDVKALRQADSGVGNGCLIHRSTFQEGGCSSTRRLLPPTETRRRHCSCCLRAGPP
ncbi:MAG: hypothetical protein KVP17_000939 [Porospora cf. gigantea B]|uniref:uncharacterized protein n=1 Tax=Porospora cf. gigantea B TaxID=2853592 RepID=UPI003571F43C|nr:MAG: hypothetical protein KVP17_000939 [Porospora cf. gigantea B]